MRDSFSWKRQAEATIGAGWHVTNGEFIMAMALAGFEPSFRALGHATKQVGRRGTHPTKIRVPVQQIDGWGRLTKWGAFNR